MKAKTITADELEEKKEAAEAAREIKEGIKIRVLSARFNKVGLDIEVEKTVTRPFPGRNGELELREFSNLEKSKFIFMPHEDLRLAFDLLRSHLLIITEQKESFDAYGETISPQSLDSMEEDVSPLAKIKVFGFNASSGYSVEIVGSKIIRGKHTLGLATPPTFFEGYEEDFYEYGDELKHVVMHAIKEVELYYHGKYAPDSQLSLDFEDDSTEETF
ncbi:MAG: hypothetical protein AAGB30_11180 [Pedobacter sp.]|nr:hypothetical protein [Pedobacter sp.]